MDSFPSYGLYDVEAPQSPSPNAPAVEEKRDFIPVILRYKGGSDHVIMRRPNFKGNDRVSYTFNVRLYTTELDECRGIEVRVPEELWTHFSPSVNTWIAKPVPTQYEPDRSKLDTREQHALSDQTREEVLGKEERHGDCQVEARMKNGHGGGIVRIGNPNGTARESAAETSATPNIDPQSRMLCRTGTDYDSQTNKFNSPSKPTHGIYSTSAHAILDEILALFGALLALHVLANLLPPLE
ncbi:hypothetical protein DFP72DRAFT_854588 [Ephemerocybe angulata]|uniref:Uncharacterized protein n=1 Tax=Ephemerocybe angulata TaxID=980116 RepID=A0A8H6LZZ5_9AGAR|nr:hypothetical protein DFP72DRAFT_854588 [Tulosesus angulatus]